MHLNSLNDSDAGNILVTGVVWYRSVFSLTKHCFPLNIIADHRTLPVGFLLAVVNGMWIPPHPTPFLCICKDKANKLVPVPPSTSAIGKEFICRESSDYFWVIFPRSQSIEIVLNLLLSSTQSSHYKPSDRDFKPTVSAVASIYSLSSELYWSSLVIFHSFVLWPDMRCLRRRRDRRSVCHLELEVHCYF